MVSKKIKKKKNKPVIPKAETVKLGKPTAITSPGFSFLSTYPWVQGTNALIRKYGFTNYCVSKEDFADEMVYILNVMVPKLYTDWKLIFRSGGTNKQFPHCHTLTIEVQERAKNIAETIHASKFDFEEDETISWWQLGFIGSTRIIGLYNRPTSEFYPLFVDRHHLLFPSKNYNQKDFNSFSYNPKF